MFRVQPSEHFSQSLRTYQITFHKGLSKAGEMAKSAGNKQTNLSLQPSHTNTFLFYVYLSVIGAHSHLLAHTRSSSSLGGHAKKLTNARAAAAIGSARLCVSFLGLKLPGAQGEKVLRGNLVRRFHHFVNCRRARVELGRGTVTQIAATNQGGKQPFQKTYMYYGRQREK